MSPLGQQYVQGRQAALIRFKLADTASQAPNNLAANQQQKSVGGGPNPTPSPPTSAAPPLAAGLPKAKVLG